MLDPRAIALQGIGYGPRLVALQGLWPVTQPAIRRGDDGDHDAYRRFWKAKREEALEEYLETVEGALRASRKARKRIVADFKREAPRIAEDPALAPIVDVALAIAEALVVPVPDYTAISEMVAAEQERLARIRRRRRQQAAIMVLIA